MHLAVESGSAPACALLLQHGACVQAINRKLETPLHLAAAAGRQDIVYLLLESGAEPLARDADGRNVFQVAADEEMRSILLHANGTLIGHVPRVQRQFRMISNIEHCYARFVAAHSHLADCADCDTGCGMVVQRRLLQQHQRTDCPFRSIACPQCATQLRAQFVSMHLDTICLFSRVPCPAQCGTWGRTPTVLPSSPHRNVHSARTGHLMLCRSSRVPF